MTFNLLYACPVLFYRTCYSDETEKCNGENTIAVTRDSGLSPFCQHNFLPTSIPSFSYLWKKKIYMTISTH